MTNGDDTTVCDERRESYRERLRKKDATMFEVAGHPVSYNEVHAAQYGLIGVFLGAWFGLTGDVEAVLSAVGACAAAVGLRGVPDDKCPTFALKTIRHEPHYFVTVFVAVFVVGMVAPDVAADVAEFAGTV